ncbi:exostosin family protein [Actinidia rufa]|uniref:Exostosin family protein n=1 Tax=Actinidia rufa TaxID=165716 RepID=A0A7J0EAC6_9ERIC|nr:exostosin family protein [Actinidia rufa]
MQQRNMHFDFLESLIPAASSLEAVGDSEGLELAWISFGGSQNEMDDTILSYLADLSHHGTNVRVKLVEERSGVEDVVTEEGTSGEAGKQATQNCMSKSIFCLNPAGDTPSSARLFDAVVSGCIPVIVIDEWELPFEEMLDY